LRHITKNNRTSSTPASRNKEIHNISLFNDC